KIAGLHIKFFEEECMTAGDFLRSSALVLEQVYSLLRTAVNREMKFEFVDSEIVFGAKFGENFLNVGSVLISSRFCEFDDRLTVLGRFHRVLFETRVLLLIVIDELDSESRVTVDCDFCSYVSLARRLQRNGSPIAENQLAAGKRLAAMDKHIDDRPF